MLALINKPRFFSVAIFLLFAGSFTVALFFKENLLWMDEILSCLLISDPSIAHMNSAVVSGMDANPPLFVSVYWLIAHAVSLNVVFLKAISIVFFATTLTLFYRYTTRLTGSPTGNFLLITGLAAFTYINVTLATQIRSYALFLLITFVYFTILHRLTRQPTNPKLLLAHTVTGLLMVLTHNFGLFYLAAGGAFFGLLWLWSMDRRYWYILGTFSLIGVVWLLAWYPKFVIQAKTGEPHSWIPLPTFVTFFRTVGELEPTVSNKIEEMSGTWPVLAILRFLLLFALFGYIALPRLKNGAKAAVADPAFMFYLLAGFIYSVVITITLVVSFLHTSLFISRYMWPSHLLVTYQLVYAYYGLADRPVSRFVRPGYRLVNWLLPAFIITTAGFLFYQSRKLVLAPTTVMTYVDRLDKKYPVFLESMVDFIPSWYYKRDRPVRFLLDYASAFEPRNEPGATVGYHILAAVKAKYSVEAVMPATNFNAVQTPHFFVVDQSWTYQIERFIQNKSVRVIRTIPTTMAGYTILECVFERPAYTASRTKSN